MIRMSSNPLIPAQASNVGATSARPSPPGVGCGHAVECTAFRLNAGRPVGMNFRTMSVVGRDREAVSRRLRAPRGGRLPTTDGGGGNTQRVPGYRPVPPYKPAIHPKVHAY